MDDPLGIERLETIETAFAVLHQSATEVFKRRKSVRIRVGADHVDLGPLGRRQMACVEEDRRNLALSPDVGRGVVPVTRDARGGLQLGGEGAPVDWALRMRRLPDHHRAQRRLSEGVLDELMLRRVATRIARFHERARGVAVQSASGPVFVLDELIRITISPEDGGAMAPLPKAAARAEQWQRELLTSHESRFVARAQTDSIRLGHGELALDHVFVDDAGEVRILAGLEVAPELRNADVAADVALLAADLAGQRRVDLAERFVAEYARLANDFDLYPLLDFYTSLRASLRAKLDWTAAALGGADAERYRQRAERFLELATAIPRRSLLPPLVVAVGGQVASGKSTVALEIARRIGAPVVGADATRDFLLGARLNEDLHEVRWAESYAADLPERVYGEVLRRAGEVLVSGRPVVIDGCFRSMNQRLGARSLAKRFELPFLFVEATVSPEVQTARLEERATRDAVPLSDWQSIADQLRGQWQPVTGLAPDEHLALDTARPLASCLDRVEARIPTWPEGPHRLAGDRPRIRSTSAWLSATWSASASGVRSSFVARIRIVPMPIARAPAMSVRRRSPTCTASSGAMPSSSSAAWKTRGCGLAGSIRPRRSSSAASRAGPDDRGAAARPDRA